MRIPEIAQRLHEIGESIQAKCPDEAAELFELAAELPRRSSGTRAPATSNTMTPELADDIREFAEQNPSMAQQAIAEYFGVNHGRVSEGDQRKENLTGRVARSRWDLVPRTPHDPVGSEGSHISIGDRCDYVTVPRRGIRLTIKGSSTCCSRSHRWSRRLV